MYLFLVYVGCRISALMYVMLRGDIIGGYEAGEALYIRAYMLGYGCGDIWICRL
jgi:hypothetical protein